MLQFCRRWILSLLGLQITLLAFAEMVPSGLGPWSNQASVLSFTSGSQAFLALIFISYFCIPLRFMSNTWMLSCSNMRLRETCFGFAQSPKLSRHLVYSHNVLGCRQPHGDASLPPGTFLLCCWPPFLATGAPQTFWTQPGKWGKGRVNLRGYNRL